eukprot:1881394-Karenia_brevis.AAC.1
MDASLTGVPPFRMKINVRVNMKGEIKRINSLTDDEYKLFSSFFYNGAKCAAYRIIIIDQIGNVPADMDPYT